jgi:CheY-like chemotaxis protein
VTATILVVDDDPFIRKLIATTLEDVARFELEEAADGAEAVEVAHRTHPRIVFLDVEMPRMNGLDACRALRADDELSNTHIVMLTAGAHHHVAAHDAGADMFLTKPFSPLDLLQLVHELER